MTNNDNDDDVDNNDNDKGLPPEGRLTRRQSRPGFPVRVVIVVAVACVSLNYSSTHYTTMEYYSPMGLVTTTTTTTTTTAVVVDVGGTTIRSPQAPTSPTVIPVELKKKTDHENVTSPSSLSSSQPPINHNNNSNNNDTEAQKDNVIQHQGGEVTASHGRFSDNGFQFQVTSEQERLFKHLKETVVGNGGSGGSGGGSGATTCSWKQNESNVSQECIDLLSPIAQKIRFWYFLGDSTMARPFRYCMVPKLQNRSQTLKFSTQRSVRKYFGISDSEGLKTFNPINYTLGEGPLSYVKGPYQFGCRTCQNRRLRFRKVAPTSSSSSSSSHQRDNDTNLFDKYNLANNSASLDFSYAEFLTVEYARDVELATTLMPTTQDTIARYMQQNRESLGIAKNQTACIISSGMHDLGIPHMSSEVYVRNHVAMRQLLKGAGCDIWIRLELTARGYHAPDVETNERIFEWNEAIKRTMEPDEYQIELFAKSLNAQHSDALHMDVASFYCPLVDFFVSLMGVSEDINAGS